MQIIPPNKGHIPQKTISQAPRNQKEKSGWKNTYWKVKTIKIIIGFLVTISIYLSKTTYVPYLSRTTSSHSGRNSKIDLKPRNARLLQCTVLHWTVLFSYEWRWRLWRGGDHWSEMRKHTGDCVAHERSTADQLLLLRVVRLVELKHLAIVTDRSTELRTRQRCTFKQCDETDFSDGFKWLWFKLVKTDKWGKMHRQLENKNPNASQTEKNLCESRTHSLFSLCKWTLFNRFN